MLAALLYAATALGSASLFEPSQGNAAATTRFDIMPIEELQGLLADPRRMSERQALRQRFTSVPEADKRIYFYETVDRQGKPMLAERGCLYTELKARRRIKMLVAQAAKTPLQARERSLAYERFQREADDLATPRLGQVATLLGDASSGTRSSLRDAMKTLSQVEQDVTAHSIAHRSKLGGDAQTWALTPVECRVSYLALEIVDQVFGAKDLERVLEGDKDLTDASFLLLQHLGRRPDVQRQYLLKVEQGVQAGLFPSDRYALLWDRLATAEGGQQRYGTQLGRGPGECLGLPPADRTQVSTINAQRRKIGLEPLANYMRNLAKAYQTRICPT